MNQRRICRNIANALLIPFNSATKVIGETSLYSVSHRNRHQFYGMPFKTSTSVAITIYIKQLEKHFLFLFTSRNRKLFSMYGIHRANKTQTKVYKTSKQPWKQVFSTEKITLSHIRISPMDST